ncbi:alpha/beta hydrolase [Dyadobacter psychrotolerans]|uniref:Alpha/beta hydrolase n=1 Tax=Dyadobacter psychrotolerans TaxID=2541721 RepID=A0A4R5DCP6_9BACT|nr:alpha/beta hydrolase [Dyadobacter psychrotolerans]TDE10767.1 alpha/beta hydrolase [Dyadobacter psychrotolerans]
MPIFSRHPPDGLNANPLDTNFNYDLQNSLETSTTKKNVVYDGYQVDFTIVRPSNNSENLPVFVFIYSESGLAVNPEGHQRMLCNLVEISGVSAVFVHDDPEARQNPELYVFKVFAAVNWIAENGEQIQVDSNKIALVGSGCGSNIATIVSLMAACDQYPKISLQILMNPVFNVGKPPTWAKAGSGLPDRNNSGPGSGEWYDVSEIMRLPIQADKKQLSGLPKTIIHRVEDHIFQNEIDYFSCKLKDAGVQIGLHQFEERMQDIGLNDPTIDHYSQPAFLQVAQALRAHFA